MPKQKSNWKANLLLLAVSILVCLAAAEGIVRLLRPADMRRASMPRLMVHDDTLGWRGEPNTMKLYLLGDLTIEIKTNELGFRDDPFPPWDEVKDKKRILFLGDSFCWGFGVQKDERISEVIESFDPDIEAYNFGIAAYSTDQELLTYKMYADQIKPHAVILLFCINDLITNNSDIGHRTPKPHFHAEPDGSLTLGNVPVPHPPKPMPVIGWIQYKSSLYQAITSAISLAQVKIGFQKQRQRAAKSKKVLDNNALGIEGVSQFDILKQKFSSDDITPYLLRDLRDKCEKSGTSFTVIMVPSSHQWTERHERTPAEVELVNSWCRQLDIQALDLFPVFHQHYQETGANLYVFDFTDRMHWNANGHRLAAEVLYQHLQDSRAEREE